MISPRAWARWPYWVLLLVVLLVLGPDVVGPTKRDSGAFLYVAQRIIAGEVPYRDAWDHKGPVIYYTNALGLWLSAGRLWGVWGLQLLSLWFSACMGYAAMKRSFGAPAAAFGSGLWILSAVPFLYGGNLVESWALLAQFAGIFLFAKVSDPQAGKAPVWCLPLLGATACLALLLRPNLIGVWIAAGSVWLATDRWRAFSRLAMLVISAAGVLFAVGLYFAFHGALAQLWDAVMGYNVAYSGSQVTMAKRASVALFGIQLLAGWPMVFCGWAVAAAAMTKAVPKGRQVLPLVALMALLLPVEMALSSLSGRRYEHYILSWMPVVALTGAYLAFCLSRRCELAGLCPNEGPAPVKQNAIFLRFVAVAALVAIMLTLIPAWRLQVHSMDGRSRAAPQAVAAYVRSVTSAGDSMLVWGAESYLYFLSERRAPGRYFYQYPLVTPGYATATHATQFLADVRAHPPRVVIDVHDPALPPLDAARRAQWQPELLEYGQLPVSLDAFFATIDREYERVPGFGNWTVYRLRDTQTGRP